jgi:hypothetical protein
MSRGWDTDGRGLSVTLFGTRGSLPAPGPDTTRYGGNTSCVMVKNSAGQAAAGAEERDAEPPTIGVPAAAHAG